MEVRVRLPQIDEQMKDMYFYTSDWRAQSCFHKSVKRTRGVQDSMEICLWNLVLAAAGSGVIFLFVSVHSRSDTAN